MDDDPNPAASVSNPQILSRSPRRWLLEGARTAIFRQPGWEGLDTNALLIARLTVAGMLLNVLFARLYIDGPATFYWQAVTGGWICTAFYVWACYLLKHGDAASGQSETVPGTAHLFTMVAAQAVVTQTISGTLYVLLVRADFYSKMALQGWVAWSIWLVPIVWVFLAQSVLLWKSSGRRRGRFTIAMLAIAAGMALYYGAHPANFWYPQEKEEKDEERTYLKLTQEIMEAQPELFDRTLAGVRPQRAGTIDLYGITFAPYEQDVFWRESEMVHKVMSQRFDAEGRVVQLVNNVKTVEAWPWATPLNLRRAIARIAQTMDRDEDVFFIHLTSHGAQDGEMAAYFWPLEVKELHPAELRQWLDEAGIRNRVISISACYSGSWIEPLSDDNTLVMTAADKDHTSYGCGSKSDLTFFGKAVYDEQLRNRTLSFEDAYKEARLVIERREKEAGKDDGFSNPQITVGAAIRMRLAQLQNRLGTTGSSPGK